MQDIFQIDGMERSQLNNYLKLTFIWRFGRFLSFLICKTTTIDTEVNLRDHAMMKVYRRPSHISYGALIWWLKWCLLNCFISDTEVMRSLQVTWKHSSHKSTKSMFLCVVCINSSCLPACALYQRSPLVSKKEKVIAFTNKTSIIAEREMLSLSEQRRIRLPGVK